MFLDAYIDPSNTSHLDSLTSELELAVSAPNMIPDEFRREIYPDSSSRVFAVLESGTDAQAWYAVTLGTSRFLRDLDATVFDMSYGSFGDTKIFPARFRASMAPEAVFAYTGYWMHSLTPLAKLMLARLCSLLWAREQVMDLENARAPLIYLGLGVHAKRVDKIHASKTPVNIAMVSTSNVEAQRGEVVDPILGIIRARKSLDGKRERTTAV